MGLEAFRWTREDQQIPRVEGMRLGIAGLDWPIELVLGSFRFLLGVAGAQV